MRRMPRTVFCQPVRLKGSVEGLFRRRTRRLPEASRTLERFSTARTPAESGCPPLGAHRCMLAGVGRPVDPRASLDPSHA